MAHTNLAFIRALPGQSQALGQALQALVAPSLAEDGCITYIIHQSKDDPQLWMAYETWESAEILSAHFQQPHMQAFVARLPELVEGELDLRAFTPF
ncbi:putative quinol monooxygenase [Caulobacter sp. CCNWLY153]|uniref:Antibiotic biosynthesis monooxygenase n=1 Tax=Caulobacter radicis TaxID=2172650 RepID=A0A2T9JM89_9CAUL|nr:putative quinol monooxygenase [Caulobacter radicis]PVM84778.1 antibiotic biosynthesis monooxygenase [Caulobacter radicis]